jgi:hypothetical protein
VTFPEFALAMFLAKMAVSGEQIPYTLPANMEFQFKEAIRMTSQIHISPAPLTANYSSPSGSPSNRNWLISPQEKMKYDLIFKTHDAENAGFITGWRSIIYARG